MDKEVHNEQLNNTLQAGAWYGRATIPAVEGVLYRQSNDLKSEIPYNIGDVVGDYTLTRLLCIRPNCTLFLCEDKRQERAVIKLYKPGVAISTAALRKLTSSLRMERCDYLMPLLSYGYLEDGIHYHVMPVYQQGTLENAVVSEEDLVGSIIPQLTEALSFLEKNHLVHNDIKPANLFWKDRSKTRIVLGDYDCLTTDKEKEKVGGTLLFMAPERIYSQGKEHTIFSDYCSMGLTLTALLLGRESLLGSDVIKDIDQEKLQKLLYRRWQQPVKCPDSLHASEKTQILLNCLTLAEPEMRKSFLRWINNRSDSIIPKPDKKKYAPTNGLLFLDKMILDIPELIRELGNNWEYGVFMFTEHQLDNFISRFDRRYYSYCQKYTEVRNHSAGLFMLMQSISPSTDFYWMGEHFESLGAFLKWTEENERFGLKDPFSMFCRSKLLSFYLQQRQANAEQIERAREIEEIGKNKPEIALQKLQISLQQKPDFVWHGTAIKSLEDLLLYLENHKEQLDEEVAGLYSFSGFKVWLDYIQHGSMLSAIDKMIIESGL